MVAEVIWGVLALRMLAGATRVRRALRQLRRAEADGDPEGWIAIQGPAGNLTIDAIRGASAWGASQNAEVVHLLPDRGPVGFAWMAGFVLDRAWREGDWLEAREATGWASVVHRDLVERTAIDLPERVEDPAELVELQKRLARYGPGAVGVVDAELSGPDPFADRAVLEEVLNAGQALVLGPLVMLSLILWGPFVAPITGSIALVLFLLQQGIALPGSAIGVPGPMLALSPLTRLPWQIGRWLKTLSSPPRRLRLQRADAARPAYEELTKDGLDHFFDPPRADCPLCGGAELVRSLDTPDLWQGKPGRFRLDRCTACGHIFQNPRLSIEGLGFYYRDFYDGLGEEDLETLFGSAGQPYEARAEMVTSRATPERWLDVGCGHGHFCHRAKELLPDCVFDGLDLSESVEDAQRRGWLQEAHRGLFVDRADDLADSYDAVSMSHYLEHTLDPRAELHAAATVLKSGGHLLIEVPDPDSWVGRVLGRLWTPWFQPQHLHFVSVANITNLLEEAGLDPVAWHRREAHIPTDLLLATWSLLNRVAPQPGQPWRKKPGPLARLWNGLVWTPGVAVLIAALLLDKLTAPLIARAGGSNAYRVVAQKR